MKSLSGLKFGVLLLGLAVSFQAFSQTDYPEHSIVKEDDAYGLDTYQVDWRVSCASEKQSKPVEGFRDLVVPQVPARDTNKNIASRAASANTSFFSDVPPNHDRYALEVTSLNACTSLPSVFQFLFVVRNINSNLGTYLLEIPQEKPSPTRYMSLNTDGTWQRVNVTDAVTLSLKVVRTNHVAYKDANSLVLELVRLDNKWKEKETSPVYW